MKKSRIKKQAKKLGFKVESFHRYYEWEFAKDPTGRSDAKPKLVIFEDGEILTLKEYTLVQEFCCHKRHVLWHPLVKADSGKSTTRRYGSLYAVLSS